MCPAATNAALTTRMMMVTTKIFAEVDSKRQLTFPSLVLYPLVC